MTRRTRSRKKQSADAPAQSLTTPPRHIPTAETRESVAIARCARMSDEELALSFGITVEELREHYDDELVRGAAIRRRELVQALYKRGMDGNTAAIKLLETVCDRPLPGPKNPRDILEQMARAAKKGVGSEGGKAPKPPPQGKKDKLNAESRTAEVGTQWQGILRPPGVGLN